MIDTMLLVGAWPLLWLLTRASVRHAGDQPSSAPLRVVIPRGRVIKSP